MNPLSSKKDRDAFLKSLLLWDRPESQFGGHPLDSDTDVDLIVDSLFSLPSRGFLKDRS